MNDPTLGLAHLHAITTDIASIRQRVDALEKQRRKGAGSYQDVVKFWTGAWGFADTNEWIWRDVSNGWVQATGAAGYTGVMWLDPDDIGGVGAAYARMRVMAVGSPVAPNASLVARLRKITGVSGGVVQGATTMLEVQTPSIGADQVAVGEGDYRAELDQGLYVFTVQHLQVPTAESYITLQVDIQTTPVV